ncbi:MAG TPA: 7-cyano-7-deazaguanine synthase, partial [Methanomassiliicoccales archaeon]|nr:7-cyano-7-deazaguanine synthase [Methanomassiliicoccales archaeon]
MRAVCLLSGGIDSPVAAYMMLERGLDVILLHMENSLPVDAEEMTKVEEISALLGKAAGRKVSLFSAPHARNQDLIERACRKGFQCVLCK